MEIQSILDKYSPETFNSLNIENNILDIEKELIFEKEHQIPSLITSSKRPFDKNICYYDLPLVKTIKENIIPKNKYKLKYEQEIKPLNIDSIFNEKNDILKESSDNELRNKKIEIIKNNQYKEYIPKIKLNLTCHIILRKQSSDRLPLSFAAFEREHTVRFKRVTPLFDKATVKQQAVFAAVERSLRFLLHFPLQRRQLTCRNIRRIGNDQISQRQGRERLCAEKNVALYD